MKKLNALIFITLLTSSLSYGQGGPGGHWRLGGNGTIPAVDDITPPGKNYLGSIAGINVPIMFGTNGIQRMAINEVL